MAARTLGTVRTINPRGFGFIRCGRDSYFFHGTALENSNIDALQIGATVSFEVADSPKGPRAEAVRVEAA